MLSYEEAVDAAGVTELPDDGKLARSSPVPEPPGDGGEDNDPLEVSR